MKSLGELVEKSIRNRDNKTAVLKHIYRKYYFTQTVAYHKI